MKRLLLYGILVTGIAGCGLFTPRTDFEPPATETGVVDHFNFADLLAGTGEKFSKLDWYELFDDNLIYVNVRLANVEYTKTKLISHLFQQHERYPDAKVVWTTNDFDAKSYDTLTLSNVDYSVESGESTFTGTSNFTVIRDAANIFRIVVWTDEPATDPFFSPDE